MLVLKRLVVLRGHGRGRFVGGGGGAWPASASPRPGSSASESATPVMDDIVWFHDFLLWLITAITLFVLVLLVDVMCIQRRSQSRPSRTTHNT